LKYAPVLLSLGSNLGDREDNLRRAIRALMSQAEITLLAVSSIYETEPLYYRDQPFFFNLVLAVATDLEPLDFWRHCRQIEQSMGRPDNRRPNAPRIIDIDIVSFDKLVLSTAELQVPHPRFTERRFVLQPMREIMADLQCPPCTKTVAELEENCTDDSCVVKLKPMSDVAIKTDGVA